MRCYRVAGKARVNHPATMIQHFIVPLFISIFCHLYFCFVFFGEDGGGAVGGGGWGWGREEEEKGHNLKNLKGHNYASIHKISYDFSQVRGKMHESGTCAIAHKST